MGTICDARRPNWEVRDIACLPTADGTQRTQQILQESGADSSMCAVQKRSLPRDSEKWTAFPVAGERCWRSREVRKGWMFTMSLLWTPTKGIGGTERRQQKNLLEVQNVLMFCSQDLKGQRNAVVKHDKHLSHHSWLGHDSEIWAAYFSLRFVF